MKNVILFVSICLSVNSFMVSQTLDWAKSMGGVSVDIGTSLAIDRSGNTLITGSFGGTVDFDPNAGTSNFTAQGSKDVFIQKLDPDGNLIWAKRIGANDMDAGSSIAVDSAGNVYTTGIFAGTVDFDPNADTTLLTATGLFDAFIQKLDKDGDLIWAKSFGGPGRDIGLSLDVTKAGDVYTTGYFEGTVDLDPNAGTSHVVAIGFEDVFIQKLDTDGNFLWGKSVGGIDLDRGYSIAVDGWGNAYCTGNFHDTVDFDPGVSTFELSAKGEDDTFIQKLDPQGNLLWAKALGGPGQDRGYAVSADKNGNICITGTFHDTVDFDPGPATLNLSAIGQRDIFVQKLDSMGNLLWAKGMGGKNWDEGHSIATDVSGNVYTAGYFSDTVDFDPNSGKWDVQAVGDRDMFIQKLDHQGNLLWVVSMGGTGGDHISSLALDGPGFIYSTGYFANSVDFDPHVGVKVLAAASPNLPDIFIQKLTPFNVGFENLYESTIRLYPNPADSWVFLELPPKAKTAQMDIVDGMGRKVYKGQLTQGKNKIFLPHLVPGVYYIRLNFDKAEKVYGKKFVIK